MNDKQKHWRGAMIKEIQGFFFLYWRGFWAIFFSLWLLVDDQKINVHKLEALRTKH